VHLALEEIASHPESLTIGAKTLLDAAERLLDAAIGTFQQQWDSLSVTETVKIDLTVEDILRMGSERIELCDKYGELLVEMTDRIIPVLDGAEPQYVPAEIEPLVDEIIKSAGAQWGVSACVLTSSYEYNYSIAPYDMSKWYYILQRPDLAKGDEMVVLLDMPRLERTSVPLHAVLLGHEVGHLCTWVSELLDAIDPEFSAELFAPVKSDDELQTLQDFYKGLCAKWLEELCADIFSTLLMGPAALLSLDELAGTVSARHTDYGSHPDTRRRLSVMMRSLEEQGYREKPELVPIFEEYEAEAGEEPRNNGSPPARGSEAYTDYVLWSVIGPLVEDHGGLQSACRRALTGEGGFEKEAQKLVFMEEEWTDVEAAIGLLKEGIPAGELRIGSNTRVTSPAVVMNAAWFLKWQGMRRIEEELSLESGRMTTIMRTNYILDQLVLKSFEIIARSKREP
jgi:hypothetical protein